MTTLEHLFQPIAVGRMRVKNRIMMAPMERNYANRDGTVSERMKVHYAARARGGVGWIDVESTFIDPAGRGRTHQLGIHEDACVPGLAELVQVAHTEDVRIGIELHHAGRNTSSAISGHEVVAPSPVPCPEAGPDTPRALTIDEIDEIVRRYGDAARRAADAGFDAVELHSAHGYLPLAFLSPLTNRRTDEYGGSLANRMRFALQVIAELRKNIRDGMVVGCRFSGEEFLPGGLTVAETSEYARALEAAGADYLSVSAGVYASFAWIIPPMSEPAGWMLPIAAAIKTAVSIPVIGVSRFTDPDPADRAIREGQVDLVAFGRAFLTDPDWPRKARDGRAAEIVQCIGCNQGCTARIAAQLDVTCLVTPETGRELQLQTAPPKKQRRVVVVGGGPAGMEAARVAAERGHEVVLLERTPELGGQARLAGLLPHRENWLTYVRQAEERLHRSGAEVRLGAEADEKVLRSLAPDAIVFATGATWLRPLQPANGHVVHDPVSLFQSPIPSGRVVVTGGGVAALGIAEWLAERGAEVSLVVPEPTVVEPIEQPGLAERLELNELIRIHVGRELTRVENGSAFISASGAIGPLFQEELPDVTSVVAASERRNASGLAWLARERELAPSIYTIGDCESPRSAYEAVLEGAITAREI